MTSTKTTRAYSRIEIKSVDNESREIRGIASTPTTDRMGDIVVPEGAKFTLPIPLLWQHEHDKPIGSVTVAEVTKKGIEVVAKLVHPTEDMPGQMAARLQEAWASIKSGLVRGLSIGFSPLKYSFIEDGGIEFSEWDWHELSAVTIPAQSEASILNIKAASKGQSLPDVDTATKDAASGTDPDPAVKTKPAGVAAPVNLKLKKDTNMSGITEQRDALKAKRKELSDDMQAIMKAAADEGRTLDVEEQEAFDNHQAEMKSIDDHLKRLEAFEKSQIESARPVEGTTEKAGSEHRVPVRVKNTQKLDDGISFARFARVKLLSQVERAPVENIARHLYPDDDKLMGNITKAGVSAANTMDSTWAGDMILDGGATFADFVEYLRPRTILGQVQDRLRRLPFDTPVLIQNTAGQAQWVKEGTAKPVTSWTYSTEKMEPLTVAAIAAATKQQLRRASAAADALFRDELARAVGATLDQTFIDPAVSAVANTSPGSILNGAGGPASASGDPSIFGVRCDIQTLLMAHSDANLNFDGMFWIMSAQNAIALSQMTNEVGNLAYSSVTPTGGTLAGFPVFVSNYAPTDSNGSLIALVKGSDIFIGDEGGMDVSMSDQASILMDDDPASNMDSTTPTGSSNMVSMWQTNSVAFRVERYINWKRRRNASVAYMEVDWSACANIES